MLRALNVRHRHVALAIAIVVTQLAAADATAGKKVRKPTMADLATVWVGQSPEGPLEYFRIQLDDKGSGVLTVQYLPGREAVAYRVVSVRLEGYSIQLELQPLDAKAQPITVKGEATPSLMRLQVAGRSPDWIRRIQLERYDDLLAKIEAVTTGAQRHLPSR